MLETNKDTMGKKSFNKFCYNCQTEIIDNTQKCCPNCGVILEPNSYINWKVSFYGFLCLICLSPILITLLVILL